MEQRKWEDGWPLFPFSFSPLLSDDGLAADQQRWSADKSATGLKPPEIVADCVYSPEEASDAAAKLHYRVPTSYPLAVEPDTGCHDSVGVGVGLKIDRRERPQQIECVIGRAEEFAGGHTGSSYDLEVGDPGFRVVAVGQPQCAASRHLRTTRCVGKGGQPVTGYALIEEEGAAGR